MGNQQLSQPVSLENASSQKDDGAHDQTLSTPTSIVAPKTSLDSGFNAVEDFTAWDYNAMTLLFDTQPTFIAIYHGAWSQKLPLYSERKFGGFRKLPAELQLRVLESAPAESVWALRHTCHHTKSLIDDNMKVIKDRIVKNEFTREAAIWPEVPHEFDAAIWLCLCKDCYPYDYHRDGPSAVRHLKFLQHQTSMLHDLERTLVQTFGVEHDDVYGNLLRLVPFLEPNANGHLSPDCKAVKAFKYLKSLPLNERLELDTFVTAISRAWTRHIQTDHPEQWMEICRSTWWPEELTQHEIVNSGMAEYWFRQRILCASPATLRSMFCTRPEGASSCRLGCWANDDHAGFSFFLVEIDAAKPRKVTFTLESLDSAPSSTMSPLDRAGHFDLAYGLTDDLLQEFRVEDTFDDFPDDMPAWAVEGFKFECATFDRPDYDDFSRWLVEGELDLHDFFSVERVLEDDAEREKKRAMGSGWTLTGGAYVGNWMFYDALIPVPRVEW